MEIRKGRGFPQPLEKSLAKDARLFHSSHRPDDEDLSTIYYCRQRSLRTRMRTGEGINSNSGERGRHRPFPQTPYPARRCKNTFRKRKLCPNNLCHLKGSPHLNATKMGTLMYVFPPSLTLKLFSTLHIMITLSGDNHEV